MRNALFWVKYLAEFGWLLTQNCLLDEFKLAFFSRYGSANRLVSENALCATCSLETARKGGG